MSNPVKNYILFIDELKKNCNAEKLLKIARFGIQLYKPLYEYEEIKYHRNAVEISILSGDNFIIYNNKQYNKFKYLYFREKSLEKLFMNCPRPCVNRDLGFLGIDNNEDFLRLLIPNEFFIKKFINDIDYYKNRKFKFGRKEIEILICLLIKENKKELLKKNY